MPLQTLDRTPVEEAAFKLALRHFASGVTIITSRDDTGAAHGMTATAFSSLSLAPPLVLVAIGRATRCHAQILATKRFGVSILDEDQATLSRYFGGKATSDAMPPRFGVLADLPIIDGAMVTLACDLEEAVEGGDHSIVIGRVTDATTTPKQPLIHFDGGYRRLATD